MSVQDLFHEDDENFEKQYIAPLDGGNSNTCSPDTSIVNPECRKINSELPSPTIQIEDDFNCSYQHKPRKIDNIIAGNM